MAINLQSPGVLVKEIDATSVVPSVSTSDAGFAAAFLWGPADKITTVTSEVDLAKYFGKPSSTDVEKNWHVASNFLAYAGSLNVVRTLGANSTNAIDTLSDGDISTLSDTTPTPVGGAWTINQTATTIDATSTSGSGTITGAGKATFSITTDSSGNPTVSIVTNGANFAVSDTLVLTDPHVGTSNTAVITVATIASANAIANEDVFDTGSISTGTASFVARYAGELGNSITVHLWHQTGTFTDWAYDQYFDRAPGTSTYVEDRYTGSGTADDEIHLVVVDTNGKLSGTKGTVLELHDGISLATDAKDAQGNSNYWKDVLRRDSQYIYGTGQWDNIQSAWEGNASDTATTFADNGVESIALIGGTDDDDAAAVASDAAAASETVTN